MTRLFLLTPKLLLVWLTGPGLVFCCADPVVGQEKEEQEEQVKSFDVHWNGERVAVLTETGEVWIGGDKAGSFEEGGEVWVGGEEAGSITDKGEVWRGGDKVGDFTEDGEVWIDGDQVGSLEKDGTIWHAGDRAGSFSEGANRRHVALIVFFGFFKLEDDD